MHRIAREYDPMHLNLGWLTIGVFRHLCNQQLINLIAMRRDEVLAIVKAHQAKLQELGVKSLDVFGSVARDEARPDSDVDFLVEFSTPVGFFDFFRIQHYLEDILGRDIDLGTQDALREHLREPVLKDGSSRPMFKYPEMISSIPEVASLIFEVH
jgi:hypothetical protein